MGLPRRARCAPFMIVLLAGCGPDLLTPEALPPELGFPDLSVASWERVVRDRFSLRLPPGFVRIDAVAIDSDAATYVRDRESLHYDYGAYSGPWRASPNEPVSEIVEAWAVLEGRATQLVSYRLAGRFVVRGWWSGVGRSTLGKLDLVVRGEADTREARRELLAVLHSVRFD